MQAWESARSGDRAAFEQALGSQQDYLLYPYLKYEDLRHRRARVAEAEMSAFLETHDDWAFAAGLKTAWLRTLGKRNRWDAILQFGGASSDAEVRCFHATARIKLGDTSGLLNEARQLWTAGKSQPDACDPVFAWLQKHNGISSGLAWQRIRLAMEAREPRLTRYLTRFLDEPDRIWADRWYRQDRGGYRQLARAAQWDDSQQARDIASYGIRRLARSDPDLAWKTWLALEQSLGWSADDRGELHRELALWSAVDGAEDTPQRMAAVAETYRDGRLMEWWARYAVGQADWSTVRAVVEAMPEDQQDDSRWRFWLAWSNRQLGQTEPARVALESLALEANYHGFLAADMLDLPYSICPEEPTVSAPQLAALETEPGVARALELRRVDLGNWARREWQGVMKNQDRDGLRTGAALATREDWPDMAIFALGNSGDLRWYEWRFPTTYSNLVGPAAERYRLDPSWVQGLMRSESALAEDAISSAGARGLMQVTPATARQLASKHPFEYHGRAQLLQPEDNIQFGTAYLRDLLDRFGESPVLAAAAYNAGPHAVERWLSEDPVTNPAVWIETLPYFETRDYIPRVLAFTALYDWRLNGEVTRLSSRMPPISGASAADLKSTDVVCKVSP